MSLENTPTSRRKLRRLRWLGVCLTIFLVAWLVRDSWLPLLAAYLDVSETPRPADFIVVLSGGTGDRVGTAGHLYQEGLAHSIIVSAYSGEPGIQEAKAILYRDGVPANAILIND